MWPNPGMMLKMTAMASLACASAVWVAERVQSQRSHFCASFGRRCPQYGHDIWSPVVGGGSVGGASVYSTFIAIIDSHKPREIRQANSLLPAPPGAVRRAPGVSGNVVNTA